MAQILRRDPDIGIQAFSTGLGTGLQQLMQMKMKEMQEKKQGAAMEAMGLPAQASLLPPQVQAQLLRSQQEQKGLEALRNLYGKPQVTPQEIPSEQQAPEMLPGMQQEGPQVTPEQLLLSGSKFGKGLADIKEKQLDRAQKERLEGVKSEGRMKEASFREALKSSKEMGQKIETAKDSYRANKDVLRLLGTGKVDTGLLFSLKDWANIDKYATTPETQAAAKILAAEPIRSLSIIPGQAARLSKVFDTITNMTPQLLNSEEGLKFIAKIRMGESKAIQEFQEAKLNAMDKYRETGKIIPFNLDQRVGEAIKTKLDKHYSVVENLVASRIGSEKSEELPRNFKVGQKAIWPTNGLKYIIKLENGKKTWVPYKKSKDK